MGLTVFSIILFIIGTVMSLRNNKDKNLTSVGIFVLLVSIIMFWIVTSWFALLPTIIGACILFGAIFGRDNNGSSNEFENNQNNTFSNPKGIETRLYVNGELHSVTNSNANKITQSQVDNDIRIMQDCLSIINNSKNIETVVSRFNDLLDILEKMASYENRSNVKHFKELPSQALIRMEKEKPDIMNRAIVRSYEHELHNASKLKTEKGQTNRLERYFALVESLSEELPAESLEFIENLKCSYKSDLSMLDNAKHTE